jgi:hypothetical protein
MSDPKHSLESPQRWRRNGDNKMHIDYTITPTGYDRETGTLSYLIIPTIAGHSTLERSLALDPSIVDEILAMSTVEEKKARLRAEIIKQDDAYQREWESKEKNSAADFSDLEALIGVPGTSVVNETEVTQVLGLSAQRVIMHVPPVIV